MNKKTKKILIIGTVALLILGMVAGYIFTRSNGEDKSDKPYAPPVGANSLLTSAEGYLYYNDAENNICRREISTGKSVIIIEDKTVLSAFVDEVLVSDEGMLHVMRSDGVLTGESYSVETDNAQLAKEYIYYKEKDTGAISRIKRESGETESVISIAIDYFILYNNQLVFTTADHKMIYLYDLETKMPMGYFGDRQIVAFDVDDDYLIYSDATNGYRVSKMSFLTGKETEVTGVTTKTLEFKNGIVFYLENVKDEKDAYELMMNEDAIH